MSTTANRSCLLLAVLATVPSAVLAWGSDGHWAIGEIASHYLSPAAERQVSLLLEPGPYGTLAKAGYWADAHARLYRVYDEYLRRHYVNVDPSADSVDMARDCPEDCILTAIADLSTRLVDRSRPQWQRAQDFRFLIHFVADLHQPLHVVHPDGRGGNRTEVTLLGEETNLHSVWDSGLIERRLGAHSSWDVAPWKQWAWELRSSIEPRERLQWEAITDPLDWAAEGIAPARRLTFDVESGAALGEGYYEEAIPLVERRIQMAAIRLATLLDNLLGED